MFVATLGSPYLPLDLPWDEVILFLEEVDEDPYRVDRMLTTLAVTGVLDSVAGAYVCLCACACVRVCLPLPVATFRFQVGFVSRRFLSFSLFCLQA